MLRVEGHRRVLEGHLTAAAAVGSLSMVQALIAFHQRAFERYGGSTYDLETLDFEFYSGKSLGPKWNVVHALLTGWETEVEARRSYSEAEDSDREQAAGWVPMNTLSKESEDVEESVGERGVDREGGGRGHKGGYTQGRGVRGGSGSTPSLRCVGDSWFRAAVRTGGARTEEGSAAGDGEKILTGVRGSRGGITRERERILDLLLRTVLKGRQGEGEGEGDSIVLGEGQGDHSGSGQTQQTGPGPGPGRDIQTASLSLFRCLFTAEHLGAALLDTGTGAEAGSQDKDGPDVPLPPAGMSMQCVT